MFKVLELSGLFVCLEGLVKIFLGGQKKLVGCGSVKGGSVPGLTLCKPTNYTGDIKVTRPPNQRVM